MIVLDHRTRISRRDQAPGIPGDLEDHERDDETDDRIADRSAQSDDDRAGHDAERDKAIGPGMVAVRDQRRARESPTGSKSDLGGKLVPGEPDHPRGREHPEMGQVLGVDKALDGLIQRDTRRDEDCEHNRQAGKLLAAEAAQKERDPEWDSSERIAEVVDQVREECDRAREQEDRELRCRGQTEDRKAEGDCLDALARADDRAVDEAMGMAMLVRGRVVMFVLVGVTVSAVRAYLGIGRHRCRSA
jgi:hypothetical protein